MTQQSDPELEARTLFWEKMTALVLEYDLYTFNPNIKEMERDLMVAFDEASKAWKHNSEVDTTNIQHWVDRGLESAKTDVWFRCLQMINDELAQLTKEEGQV